MIDSSFNRLVVLVNPVSTQAARAEIEIARLRDEFGRKVMVIETAPELEVTRRRLLDTIEPGDIIGVAGGDGTVNVVVQTLLSASTPSKIAKTPILTFGTGNANDLSHILQRDARSLVHVLREGAPASIYPLKCTIRQPGGIPEYRYAACYASFGAIAHAAAYINASEHRGNFFRGLPGIQHLMDAVVITRALRHAGLFAIEENGHEFDVFDRVISNGPRMAKYGKFPVSLTEQEMYVATINDNSIATIASGARDLARGTLPGDFAHDETIDFRITQVHEGPTGNPGFVYAQFDGEGATYPPGTHVSICHSDRPFYALQLASNKTR